MNLKLFFIRLAGLALISVIGLMFYAVVINLLVMMGLMPAGEEGEGFGQILTRKAVYVYMGSLVPGFAGIFIKEDWRWVLYLCPLYAASLFAVIYTLSHS